MTITNCPKCGSFNITTAGVCENCGWSPFAQVALCTRITGEMELKVSGKALLDDYKRLLFENRNLTSRIAELEEKQRWIPVSERLPEGEKVLVLWKDGTIHFDWTFIEGGSYYWWNSGQANVTHWMPLPEPQEEREK